MIKNKLGPLLRVARTLQRQMHKHLQIGDLGRHIDEFVFADGQILTTEGIWLL